MLLPFYNEDDMNDPIFEKVDRYISTRLAPEDEVLTSTIQSLDDAGMPQHSVSANQGKLLQVLAKLCDAKKVLEIGTLGGYSTIWIARALPKDGLLITIEIDQEYANVAQKNIDKAGLDSIVDIRIGDAIDILNQIEQGDAEPFDMFFIDGDKPRYVEYFEWAVRKSHPGTLIVCDNVIREGKVLDEHSTEEKVLGVQRFNDMLKTNDDVTTTIIQTVGVKTFDGMALAVVR